MSEGPFATYYQVETDDADEEVPIHWVIGAMTLHTALSTFYFLLITCIAIGIDLGLHWFEKRPFVEKYGLSPLISWEVEFMAYTLATVDAFLFLRMLIKPGVDYLWGLIKQR